MIRGAEKPNYYDQLPVVLEHCSCNHIVRRHIRSTTCYRDAMDTQRRVSEQNAFLYGWWRSRIGNLDARRLLGGARGTDHSLCHLLLFHHRRLFGFHIFQVPQASEKDNVPVRRTLHAHNERVYALRGAAADKAAASERTQDQCRGIHSFYNWVYHSHFLQRLEALHTPQPS